VNHVRGFSVGKQSRPGERLFVRGGDEQRARDVREGLFPCRNGDDARMTGGTQRVRKPADVIQAVGGEVAVVDEEDVHWRRVRQ
jgi:hypothetical protein